MDGTVLGRAPPKTDTADEITMADAVPLNRRVDIRQEILSMEADDEALKVRESQEIKVKVQRSLKEAEAAARDNGPGTWDSRMERMDSTPRPRPSRQRASFRQYGWQQTCRVTTRRLA